MLSVHGVCVCPLIRQAKLESERREEEERRRRIEPQERGGRQHPVLNADSLLTLTSCRALYPFTARNADELSLDADCFIEVHTHTLEHTRVKVDSH